MTKQTGSGKARGEHHPGRQDTFGTIHNRGQESNPSSCRDPPRSRSPLDPPRSGSSWTERSPRENECRTAEGRAAAATVTAAAAAAAKDAGSPRGSAQTNVLERRTYPRERKDSQSMSRRRRRKSKGRFNGDGGGGIGGEYAESGTGRFNRNGARGGGGGQQYRDGRASTSGPVARGVFAGGGVGNGRHESGSSSFGARRGGGGDGFGERGVVRTTEGMVLFWKEPACFVQWTRCPFEVDGTTYSTAEQWMMANKARLFNDREIHRRIMSTHDPREQKALGRMVKGFDAAVWDREGFDVVVRGNLAKFKQNPRFREELLATGDKILAEASPYDSEWGIGLDAHDADALIQSRWPGKNKLGEALMEVRRRLRYGDEEDEDEDEDGGEEDRRRGGGTRWRGRTPTDEDDWMEMEVDMEVEN